MKIKLIAGAMIAWALTGCGSTPPVKADANAFQKVATSPELVAPDWMNNPPQSDKNTLWVVGTADSVNYGSSRQKAIMDAQLHLGDKLNGEINALVQQYKNDVGNSYIENTTTNIKKLIAETDLTGYSIEKTATVRIDGVYQTFVLIRYPIGETNHLLRAKLEAKMQRESVMRAQQGQIDLQRELDRKANRQAEQDRRTQETVAPDTVKQDPPVVEKVGQADSQVTTVNVANSDGTSSTLNLLPVENEEYKARRAEALKKPGAVVGQVTINN